MGEHNSPYFAAGCADGARDTRILSACPPGQIEGMDIDREWSWMYRRGYESTFAPIICPCDGSCKQRATS